ncbi:TlpA family protein disulfide reductase [Bacillus solitudinis]|uniref:TlpA family protein disulfide reductase n=1 Tax=Bacillus solitudinis TaxID=2014074 RepID=UPI001D0D2833|nr:TlpA disulfide reductase family protein [Bacillus solitudinis]
MPMKKIATMLVLAIALILIIMMVFTNENEEIGNKVGMIAENFRLPMNTGDEGQLKDHRGKVVIINMWASWCEPCRDEMPALMELQHKYGADGLEIMMVNMQTYERTLNDATTFIEEIGLTLPVYFDEEGSLADSYQVGNFPTTYVINREGVIEAVIPGEVTYEGLEKLIKPLL